MAAKAGLQQAISDGIDLRTAHEKLSDLLVTEENWSDALEHYRRAIEVPTATNTSGDYCHLGWLYLKNARYTEAEIWFFTCLDTSHDRERDISDICREYQPVGAEALMAFFTGVRGRYPLTTKMELALARSLIALKHINQAEDILIALAQRDPSSANVHYLLSRIAEIQKDWDRMELAIQKATVLDPTNLQYRQIFYDLLKRMGKLSAAEQELDRIIAATQNPGLQILEERAQMRWNRKDYPGAIQGWEEGLKIAPTRANLHANIAEAHIKLGNLKQAIAHYQKALTLDPQNKQYQQKIRDLDA
jgi:tetratricopeptide (TPR) repeat protein